jgi:hypothetical protein
MPFINGRYYVNPVMGEALEAAREAEAALAALETRARENSDGADTDDGASSGDGFDGESVAHSSAASDGPIHRVEIEAAELVPSHSGRAAHGYVARVHRQALAGTTTAQVRAGGIAPNMAGNGSTASRTHATGQRGGVPGHAETHVFADHRDLLSFLRDELAKDHSRSQRSS